MHPRSGCIAFLMSVIGQSNLEPDGILINSVSVL